MAQPPHRSRRIQGLPLELLGVSSTEGNPDHSSDSSSQTRRNPFLEFSRELSKGNQILPSLPYSNVETPLVSETLPVLPSIPNLEVLPTSSPGSKHFLPSDHNSRVSHTPFQLPDLIQFIEPLLETYLFPNEGPIQVSPFQSEFERHLTFTELPRPRNSNSKSLFEVYSETSLPLNKEQGSNSTPLRTESSNTEVTHSSHPTLYTYHSCTNRDLETPPSEDISFTNSSVSITHLVRRSSLPYIFTEYEPVEPHLDLVQRPFHLHFNQPFSYEDPFVLLQLPEPTYEPWQSTP